MEVEFSDDGLEGLEGNPRFSSRYPQAVEKSFRRVMQVIRAAHDERDLYALKGLRFKKLDGDRDHQRSIRLNDQWRLILEIKVSADSRKIIIVGIEDYH